MPFNLAHASYSATVLAVCLLAGRAPAQTYHFRAVELSKTLPNLIWDLNDSNMMVGNVQDGDTFTCILLTGHHRTDLNDPAGTGTICQRGCQCAG